MGLFKAIEPQAELVTTDLVEDSVPMFRSRREVTAAHVLEQDAPVEELVQSEPSGALFDAFSDRIFEMRKARKKNG